MQCAGAKPGSDPNATAETSRNGARAPTQRNLGCFAWRMSVDPSYFLHMQDSSRPGLTSLLDYHIHSKLCGHGVGELEEYVQYAVQSGLPEMGFSEHIFLYWLPEEERDPELAMPESAFDPYLKEVRRLQSAYPDVRLKMALEA